VGRRRKRTLVEDLETSERIARKLLNDVALMRDGVIDEHAGRLVAHDRRPIGEHVDDFLRALKAKGRTAGYILVVGNRVRRVLELARIRRISDLSVSAVQEVIADIREQTCTGTANNYTISIKSFALWLKKDKRAREHALEDLKTRDAQNDRRHIRRRMSDEEVARVIAVAEQDPGKVINLLGRDRAMLYRIAHGTGFRAAELRSLTPERFLLELDPPTITVLGC
jgi:site-specific recombinase XerC